MTLIGIDNGATMRHTMRYSDMPSTRAASNSSSGIDLIKVMHSIILKALSAPGIMSDQMLLSKPKLLTRIYIGTIGA
ncbi:hypothetical protein D3C85_1414140 [compost metagenome]